MRPRAPGTASLTVVGASVRAMAESACRAGWRVHAADLFCDIDLRRSAAQAVHATPYPAALPAIVSAFPPGPWIYTGALENHPDVLDEIAALRPLAGNGSAVVQAVRDLARLGTAVRAAGLGAPETRFDPRDVPADGTFLVKPRASAGGRGISPWHGRGGSRDPVAGSVWQRRVVGAPWSAAFVATGGRCRLLGTSRQIRGAAWCHAPRFAYRGSVSLPGDRLAERIRAQFQNLGDVLTGEFGLVGLFGADVIIDALRRIHVLEVNPRPTASMELLERGTGTSLATAHLGACGVTMPAVPAVVTAAALPGTWAKAVMFAATDLRPDSVRLECLARDWFDADGAAALADIPSVDQVVPAGSPLLTLFARAATAGEAIRMLRRRARAVDAALGIGAVSRPAAAANWPRRRRRGSTA